MNLGKTFHILAQLVGAGAQTLMGPASDLFGWDPKLVTFLHAFVGFTQMTLGILAFNADPNAFRPMTAQQASDAQQEAGKLSNLKEMK